MSTKIYNFKTGTTAVPIPETLNNPFAQPPPEIAKIAAREFQDAIPGTAKEWTYDFKTQKGKMFGVLVIQKPDRTYAYLATVSGKLSRTSNHKNLVPSIFDDATDDYFINRGMTALTVLSQQINNTTNPGKIAELKNIRKLKSFAIQQQLFKNYKFMNVLGEVKNVLQIFQHLPRLSKQKIHDRQPPSAAGECAAPKLLQYALQHNLIPVAIAEFWWGNSPPNKKRTHKNFYPACKDKCRPILEYMLDDNKLYNKRK